MLVAQAGTAISLRARGEPNTYNWITFDAPHLTIEVRGWTAGGFDALVADAVGQARHGVGARVAVGKLPPGPRRARGRGSWPR